MKKIYILLPLLVLVSGCIGIPDVFGRDVISVQQSTIENGVRDVIVVKDVQTIPKSPLLPDQQVIMSFLLENRDTLKESIARVDLFNAPTMRTADGAYPCNFYSAGSSGLANLNFCCGQSGSALCDDGTGRGYCIGANVDCPSGYTKRVCSSTSIQTVSVEQRRYCTPDQCGLEGCTILPGEEKPVNFIMRAPTERDIKNIKTDTKLNFKTTYDFDGSLNYIVPAISTDEIIKRQRSGDKTTLFTTKSHGSGPVQIDVELLGAPYILSDIRSPVESVLLFKIKNRGSGTLVKSQIDAGAMEITFPPEFFVMPNEKFTCNNNVCVNTGRSGLQDFGVIPLYRDESRSSLRFTVRLINPLQEPFRSYQITATVKYSYELRNSVDMTINPFQNV